MTIGSVQTFLGRKGRFSGQTSNALHEGYLLLIRSSQLTMVCSLYRGDAYPTFLARFYTLLHLFYFFHCFLTQGKYQNPVLKQAVFFYQTKSNILL